MDGSPTFGLQIEVISYIIYESHNGSCNSEPLVHSVEIGWVFVVSNTSQKSANTATYNNIAQFVNEKLLTSSHDLPIQKCAITGSA